MERVLRDLIKNITLLLGMEESVRRQQCVTVNISKRTLHTLGLKAWQREHSPQIHPVAGRKTTFVVKRYRISILGQIRR